MPPPPVIEHCYRHPAVETGVHCTRCGRPICTDCMYPAPVGHQCPECVKEQKQEFHRPARQVGTGPPRGWSVTNVLIAILVVVTAIETIRGGPNSLILGPSSSQLVRLGADLGPCTAYQPWRLLTSMFLHAGLIHLALNCYVLYIVGNVIEQELGWQRLLVIYFVSGLFASAMSFTFGQAVSLTGPLSPSVGASGAIFGLFGAFFAYNYRRRSLAFYAARTRSIGFLIVINLVLSFSLSSFIDWRAHVGGLVAGLVLGVTADTSREGRSALLLFVGAAIVLLLVGTSFTVGHANQWQQVTALPRFCG